MATASGRTFWKHAPSVYRRHTLLHPAHASVVAAVATLGLLAHGLVLMLASVLFVEILVLTWLPRLPWMRRVIDGRIDRDARADAVATRRKLLLRMGIEHRNELLELESVAATIRAHVGASAHDCLSSERLIELYVRFAVAHRAATVLLEPTDRGLRDRLKSGQLRSPQNRPTE